MTATLPYTDMATEVESLGTTLSAIHDRWIQRVAAVLAPALSPRSRFWERWEVMRRFHGEFDHRFRMECALIESLGGRLAPGARVHLATLRAALERTETELLATPRHDRTPGPLALPARRLLDLARYWCAEVEFATARLTRDDLPQPSRALLDRMAQ